MPEIEKGEKAKYVVLSFYLLLFLREMAERRGKRGEETRKYIGLVEWDEETAIEEEIYAERERCSVSNRGKDIGEERLRDSNGGRDQVERYRGSNKEGDI